MKLPLLQSTLMFRGVEHFAIASPNPHRLAEFYMNNLEFSIVFENAGNYFLRDAAGNLIEMIQSQGDAPANVRDTPGMRHIAIAVDDFDAAHRRLQLSGVVFEGEPFTDQGNRLVFFRDPDGTILHLIRREKPLP